MHSLHAINIYGVCSRETSHLVKTLESMSIEYVTLVAIAGIIILVTYHSPPVTAIQSSNALQWLEEVYRVPF